jgi:hypothetical protein
MNEFNLGKLVKFVVIFFIVMSVMRTCSMSTMGGYAPGAYLGAPVGGSGFLSGMLLGNMLGGNSIFGGGRGGYERRDESVRRGSMGSGFGRSRSGGFGFGK